MDNRWPKITSAVDRARGMEMPPEGVLFPLFALPLSARFGLSRRHRDGLCEPRQARQARLNRNGLVVS